MGCGSSAQKKNVAEPQPASAASGQTPTQSQAVANKQPQAAPSAPAAAPGPAPVPVPAHTAPVQTPAKEVTPDGTSGKTPVAAPPQKPILDLGNEPVEVENEALAGRLYSPKGGNNDDGAMQDLMKTEADGNVKDLLMGQNDHDSALMENAALDGMLYSAKVGQSNQDEGPIDLMAPSAPPAAEVLEVGPGGGEPSALLDNAALQGALFSPRAGGEKPADLMGEGGDLNSAEKKNLMGAGDEYEAPLMENLALDGALYSPKAGSPPPEGAGEEKGLPAAHDEGSGAVPNAALKGDLYSPRGGAGEVPDLMGEGAGPTDLIGEEGGGGSALMENAALEGALYSPRGGQEGEGEAKDVMGGADPSAEEKAGLIGEAPAEVNPLMENVALQGALFSPRAGGGGKGGDEDLIGGGGPAPGPGGQPGGGGEALVENAALDGALYSPRGEGGAEAEGAAAPREEGLVGEGGGMENAALQGALYSPRGGGAEDGAGGGEEAAPGPGTGGGAGMENAALQGALYSPRAGES